MTMTDETTTRKVK